MHGLVALCTLGCITGNLTLIQAALMEIDKMLGMQTMYHDTLPPPPHACAVSTGKGRQYVTLGLASCILIEQTVLLFTHTCNTS